MTEAADDPTVVTVQTLRDWPLPALGEDKDARGRVLLVGGSRETPGAVRLAGEAALRAGAGKVRIATDEAACPALGVALPESAVLAVPCTADGHLDPAAGDRLREEVDGVDVLLVGPGLTGVDDVVPLVAATTAGVDRPVVLDALASAYLTEHPEGLHHLAGRAVLSVNTVELARTAGTDVDEVEQAPARVAARVAERSQVVVLLGGPEKHVAAPGGGAWVVRGGGPGLGVSGSGDVQAGLVAGLLSRCGDPAQAAVWGGFLHAQAGERLIERVGQVGFLASELAPEVPSVLDLLR